MRAQVWEMNGTLGQQEIGQLLDQLRVDNRGRDGGVAEDMLLYTGGIDNFTIKVNQGLSIRKEERSIGLDLSPDKHVFSGERDLLIAFPDVGPDRRENLLLG